MNEIERINQQFSYSKPEEILKYFLDNYQDRIALASSLSIEDQVLTDMMLSINRKARIFTLDTGRLPYETYNLIEETNQKYNVRLEIFFPDHSEVEKMVQEKGINLFYESVENRKKCCRIRKIEPLKRALSNLDVWICGLRKEQSITRDSIELLEFDFSNGILKLNPLYNWSESQVWDYIKKYNVPFNALYKKNYLSIGCAPCTRAVKNGDDIRSGRWWWENPETKECGLHVK